MDAVRIEPGLAVTSSGDEIVLDVDGRALSRSPGARHPRSKRRRSMRSARAERQPSSRRCRAQVLAVRVADGDEVEAGQMLLVLEAMKMENTVVAPAAGQGRERARRGRTAGPARRGTGGARRRAPTGRPHLDCRDGAPRDACASTRSGRATVCRTKRRRSRPSRSSATSSCCVAAGLREIEATSFVSPRAIPQLTDADELMAALASGGTRSATRYSSRTRAAWTVPRQPGRGPSPCSPRPATRSRSATSG